MERRKQLQELISRFVRDFDASLKGLSAEDQLIVTSTLRKIIPLFGQKSEGYYQTFYDIYENEILEKLRSKARTLYNLRLTDYFEQKSFRLIELQHDLKINVNDGAEQFLSDEEHKTFLAQALNQINLRHQMLLITEVPTKEKPSKKLNAKPSVGKPKDNIESLSAIEEESVEVGGDREEYMSIEECAKFMSVSKVTIHQYKKDGLPFYKIGRTVKFKKSEVLDFMRQPVRKKKR